MSGIHGMPKIEVPAHIRGLIFDCDGTLVDSMPLHLRAREEVIVQQGGRWGFDYFFSKKGMPTGDIAALYNIEHGYDFSVARIVRAKEDKFFLHLTELKPIRAVVDVAVRNRGVRSLSVASGSTRRMVDLQLEIIGLRDLFDVIVTEDDNVRPKPALTSFRMRRVLRAWLPPTSDHLNERRYSS